MHSKYDNMHRNRILNELNCINNHVNSCINCMLWVTETKFKVLWQATHILYVGKLLYNSFIT